MSERDEQAKTFDQPPVIPVPPQLVTAWAAGPSIAPKGRKGKKGRRRARKLAGTLAAIVVLNVLGSAAAMAEPYFYPSSPHVDTGALIRAGAQPFDGQLARSVPEADEEDTDDVAATTLEDAILAGGL